ncbi:predicted protein [Micromonas commoda]|uniref:Uncharacterized protein n=1 Tax=Micromonas commoda (strain RCC299 / NOUM17 / CCMP2709) TaxID=296587 RepID=C1DZ54_MICCC|nr:predicted protein [Micromonas commoda]ACO61548.1 predicted protein [Micromonas commoda]|eukprot:XP_002500290.1 predicted protein [Micromonas commoda]
MMAGFRLWQNFQTVIHRIYPKFRGPLASLTHQPARSFSAACGPHSWLTLSLGTRVLRGFISGEFRRRIVTSLTHFTSHTARLLPE